MVTQPLVVPSPSLAAPRETSSAVAAKALSRSLGGIHHFCAALHSCASTPWRPKALWVDEGHQRSGCAHVSAGRSFFSCCGSAKPTWRFTTCCCIFGSWPGAAKPSCAPCRCSFRLPPCRFSMPWARGSSAAPLACSPRGYWPSIVSYHVRYGAGGAAVTPCWFSCAVLSDLAPGAQPSAARRKPAGASYSLVSALMVYAHLVRRAGRRGPCSVADPVARTPRRPVEGFRPQPALVRLC